MKIDAWISTLLGELHKLSKTESVVGRPIEIDGTHVVPVCNLSIGFGTGGAQGKGGLVSRRRFEGAAESGGAGGGIRIEPTAFVVVDPQGRAHLQSLKHRRSSALTKAIDLIPRLADGLRNEAPSPSAAKKRPE